MQVSSLFKQGQDLLSLRMRLGRLILVPNVHDVAPFLWRLNAQLARHGDSLSPRAGSVNSEDLL